MSTIRNVTAALATAATFFLPAPVAADENEVAKVIAGAIALGIVAKAIDDRNERRERRRQEAEVVTTDLPAFRLGRAPQNDRAIPYVKDQRGYIERGYIERNVRQGYKKKRLPDTCLRTIVTLRGERPAYGARCLNRNFKHARHLPQRCEIPVRTDRGTRPFYTARCLQRDGWRVAGR